MITPVLLLVLLIIVGMVIILNTSKKSKSSVKILDYGFSNCTQDIPSSSCGPYDVTVQSPNGSKSVYKVPGYSEDINKRVHYDQITSQIINAKENNSNIALEINSKNEITDTQ